MRDPKRKRNHNSMRVSDREKLVFTKNIAVMIRASIPLAQAMKSQAEQATNPIFRAILRESAHDIEAGQKFSFALEKYPRVFSGFYVHVVRAAEKAGTLEHNLEYLAEHIEANMVFKKTLASALIYPAFIMSAIAAVGVLFGYSVLPTITELLLSFDVEPPLATKIVLFALLGFQRYGVVILLGIIAAVLSTYVYIQTPQGTDFFTRILLHLPVLGGIFRRVYLAQSAKILGTLLKSGVPIHESLAILADSMENATFRDAIRRIVPEVLKGNPISPFLQKKLFPPLYVQMIEVGEKSASMEKNLDFLAAFYQKEVDHSMKNILSLLEPVLLIIVGVAVLLLALAILGPIYQTIGYI